VSSPLRGNFRWLKIGEGQLTAWIEAAVIIYGKLMAERSRSITIAAPELEEAFNVNEQYFHSSAYFTEYPIAVER
jgi:hypothetical protein